MTKLLFGIAGAAVFIYWRRYALRQAWYVLRTGDEDPDFESINASYFLGREKWEPKRLSFAEKVWARWEANRSS